MSSATRASAAWTAFLGSSTNSAWMSFHCTRRFCSSLSSSSCARGWSPAPASLPGAACRAGTACSAGARGGSSLSAPAAAICSVLSALPSVLSGSFTGHLALIRRPPCGDALLVAICPQQFAEQRTVVQQRLPEVFRAHLLGPRPLADPVRGPVILHHLRVVDRHQVGLRVEIPHRVATRVHDAVEQPVSGHDRLLRLVDEAFLHVLPLLGEPGSRLLRQRLDVEPGTLLLAITQLGLGGPPILPGLYCPVVFRAETLT